jgi:hypothetical protein
MKGKKASKLKNRRSRKEERNKETKITSPSPHDEGSPD